VRSIDALQSLFRKMDPILEQLKSIFDQISDIRRSADDWATGLGHDIGGGLTNSPKQRFINSSFSTPAGVAFFDESDYGFRAAAFDVPEYPGEFVVDVHGTPHTVELKDAKGDWHSLSGNDFADVLRATGWDGTTPIRLFACDTGSAADGFAQKLADRVDTQVTAPNKPVWSFGDGSTPIVTDATTKIVNGVPISVPIEPPNGEWEVFTPSKSGGN